MHSKILINKYAIVNGEEIECIVSVEDSKITEKDSIEILQKMFLDKKIIKISEKTSIEYDNVKYVDNNFVIKPYESWVWNNKNWIPPIPYPQNEKVYLWNEKEIKWDLFEEQ